MCYVYIALVLFIVFVRGKYLYDALKSKQNLKTEIILFTVFMAVALAIGYFKIAKCF